MTINLAVGLFCGGMAVLAGSRGMTLACVVNAFFCVVNVYMHTL